MRFPQLIADLFAYHPDAPMLFNSGAFLLMFTIFLAIYGALYQNKPLRTAYVLAFSLFFYYKASGFYLGILLLSIVLDWGVAFAIHRAANKRIRLAWLLLSVCANVGLLCYFKYTNFFLENVAGLQGIPFRPYDIFLPIGISFYTFQTLSYVIDVYKGELKPVRSLLDYAFYMSFFPHLVAGPIVRARFFLPQVREEVTITHTDAGHALFLILKGLIKKAILADYLAQYNDLIFDNPSGYSGFENLMAIYGYTLQIYCDFSGYSDMAIGIARLMGFDLGRNFDSPYKALSLTEFWRRWHISLSTWLRDYVYIPLGGNRHGKARTYLNQFVTMLIGGFWHGPSWKFVFWGAAHGAGLATHKAFGERAPTAWNNSLAFRAASWCATFHVVALLWVFFRAATFGDALTVISKAFTKLDLAYVQPFFATRALFLALLTIGFATHFAPDAWKARARKHFTAAPMLAKAAVVLVVVQLTIQLASAEVQPFIYFQF